MKKLLVIAFLSITTIQIHAQQIAPAPPGKAVVYFARTAITGFVVEFFYYDSTSFIAKANNTNYVRYECAPGTHLFWAKSENAVFLEAEIEAEKIYFIEVLPKMGLVVAEVDLNAIDPAKDDKAVKRILKLIEKKSPVINTAEVIAKENERVKKIIDDVFEKYQKRKDSGKKIEKLEKSMYYTSEK